MSLKLPDTMEPSCDGLTRRYSEVTEPHLMAADEQLKFTCRRSRRCREKLLLICSTAMKAAVSCTAKLGIARKVKATRKKR